MAGYNLGTAFINVTPRLDGLGKAIENPLAKSGDRASKGLSGKLFGGLKKGAIGAGVAMGGVLGTSVVKGFQRLSSIEQAEAKLTGLGHSAKDVTGIMDNALASVKGTAFGLDEAASLSGTLVASGIKPGKELEKTLKLTADSATIAGRELGDMGLIWGSVAAKGKLQGDDAQQLLASGVPIWQMVGDVMGKTAGEAQALGSKGQVSFEIFQKAMEKGVGGAALDAGDTTVGAFKNMNAALGRFGAGLLKGVFPLIGPAFKGLTGWIDKANEAVGPMVETFTNGVKGIYDVLANGDFTGPQNMFGLEEDSKFVDVLFTIRDTAKSVRDTVKGLFDSIDLGPVWAALGPIVEGFKGLAPVLLDVWKNLSPLGMVFDILAPVLPQIGSAIGQLATTLGGVLSNALAAVLPAISELLGALGPLFANLMASVIPAVLGLVNAVASAIQPIVAAVGPLLSSVVGALIPVIQMVVETAGPLVTMLADALAPILIKVGSIVGGLVTALTPLVTALIGMVAAVLKPLLAVLKTLIGGALAVLAPILDVILWAVGKLVPVIGFLANVLGVVAGVIGNVLGAALEWLNGVLIGMVPFLSGVFTAAWNGIKTAIAAVGSWITDTLVPALQAAWSAIASAALWLYNSAILPAWNGIQAAISAVATWVVGTLVPWLQSAWTVIANTAMWLYRNIIMPAWDGIRIAIAVAVTAVLVYIDLLKWYFSNVIAPVALWLYNSVIKPVWAGIQAAIGAVVNWMMNTAWPILQTAWNAIAGATKWLYGSVILPVWNAIKGAIAAVVNWIQNVGWPALKLTIDWIANAFKWLYSNVIQPVWNGIKTAINTVVAWLQNVAWPLINTVIGWLKTSFNGWKLLAQAVWNAVKSAINAVVAWFRDTAWPAVKGVLDKLKSGFTGMKDGVKAAWDAIKDKAIKPVMDWFSNTVKPKFDDVTGKIKTAFTNLKDGVLKAWDGIKDGMKKPINGVIGIYNEHIAGNFNKVIGTLGLDKKYELATMAEFATGGYTGPGSKYQPAGIVHADEYVIRKESQNDLRRNAPGLLDSLNQHGAKALGYATGGLVKLRSPFGSSAPRGEGFGARGGKHKGIDYPMPSGTVLKAVAAGIAHRTSNANAGNKLELSIGDGLVAGYHHLSSFIAGNGASVGRGADVARVGSTGRSSGPHLHFSLKKNGTYVDPAPYLGAGGAAGSGGDNSWWNPFTGLWSTIKDKVATAVGEGTTGAMVSKVVENTIGGVGDWVTGKITAIGDFASESLDTAGGYARFTPVATEALVREGQMGPKRFAALMKRMNQESGFNPRAINNWDSNAKSGNSSRGLMQVIPTTFNAYRDKSLSSDIYDPLANIVASIRYTLDRYGDLEKGWGRKGGYAAGGWTGPGSKYQPAGVVHADEHVIRKESRASIERARPGFLDRLNQHGAAALAGYANGGLVGYASGGKVSPTSKIGATKVTVLLDGLTGTSKQVTTAAGKLADGIVKVFNDRMKSAKTATVNKLSDSLSVLKKEASSLKKQISATTSKSKANTISKLTDDLAALRKQKSTLSATAKEVSKVTKVVGKTASGKLKTKTVTTATKDAVKAARSLKGVNAQIESTQSALTKARRGDYSGAASASTARLKAVNKEIAATDKALKAARRGDYQNAALVQGTKAYNTYVAEGVKRLEEYANRSDTLTKKLKNANTALTEAVKVRDDYTSSMTEKFAGAYSLTDTSATTGIETIIRGFKNAATTVTTFSKQLATLKSRGLSDGLIDQVAQLGAESGSKVATNLLTGTDSQLSQITKQYNALNKASASSGNVLGKQMYQSGVDSATGYVNGLSSQLSAVTKASEKLADSVVSTVRKKLGIHSPSRVMLADGLNTGQGFLNGIREKVPEVQRAMADLAAPASAYAGDVGMSGSGGRGGVTITGGQFGYTPDEIADGIERKRRKQEALHIY